MDNKNFISALSRNSGLDHKTVATLTNALLNEMKETLTNLDSIKIPGFGEFSSSKTDEHIAYDSVTKERLLFPPSIEVKFTPDTNIILTDRL